MFRACPGFTQIHTPTTNATIYINTSNHQINLSKGVINNYEAFINKDNLMNGINIVLKAVSSKTTMPILECILIDATSNEIKLTGNDMELGIETK